MFVTAREYIPQTLAFPMSHPADYRIHQYGARAKPHEAQKREIERRKNVAMGGDAEAARTWAIRTRQSEKKKFRDVCIGTLACLNLLFDRFIPIADINAHFLSRQSLPKISLLEGLSSL